MRILDRMLYSPVSLFFQYVQDPTSENGIALVLRVFSLLAVIFILFPFHECAHALAAKKLGDNTAERMGRLTLNPFPHIDPLGALCMLVLPIGWAKPFPVEPRNADRKVTMRGFIALTAAAGPVSNIILSLVFVIFAKVALVVGSGNTVQYLYYFLYSTAYTSIFLAVFNLVPIPPLDGSKILFFFLKNNQIYFIERNMQIIRLVFLVLLYVTDIIILPMVIGSSLIMKALDLVTFFIK